MKSLGVYAFISLLFVGIVGSFFFPTPVFAQVIDREGRNFVSQTGSYDFYQNSVNAHFQATNSALDDILKRSTSTIQVEPTARYKAYLAAISGAYTTTFNEEKRKGTAPVDAQLKAILAFNTALTLPSNISPVANYSASAPQRTAINQLTVKIKDANIAAEQIKRGNIAAGSAEAEILTSGSSTITNAAQANTNTTVKTSEDGGCALLGSSPISKCLSAAVNWIIKNIFLEFAGVFLWLTANMLNYAVQIGILNFSQWAPEALYPIWMIVRQIVSLLVVFMGLYLGFMYILGKEDKFEKYIPWVIMFALFVNFSYPLARTAVDISNIVSLNVYSSAVGNDALRADLGAPNTAGSIIMSRLGLDGLILSATKVDNGSAGILKELNSLPASLLAVAFVLYAAYIFFMVTALIVVRTVSLVFLTIASPILFVDSVLPVLGDRAQQIRKIFFEQLAVGPVFMIMLALTLKFLEVFSDGPMKNVGTGGDATIKTFFNILMMLIMLHIMLKVTKHVAGTLGQYATDAMGKVGGFGLGVATGGAGLLARGTLGRAASKFGQSNWVQNNKDSVLGRSALSMSNSLSNATFDLRNSKTVAGQMNKIGMGMGMGRTMGYEEHAKKQRENIQQLGETAGARYKEDVKDANGNIIHRRGDFTEEGREAYTRYNETLGGRSTFMSKEQKAKTKELIKENVMKNLTKEEAEVKRRAEELSEDYNKKDPRKSKALQKEDQEKAFTKMKVDLQKLKETDPNLKGSEAQALSAAINTVTDKREDETFASNQKVAGLIKKYNDIKDDDPSSALRRGNIYDGLDDDEKEKFKKYQNNPNELITSRVTQLTKDEQPLTGDALRQERLQKVAEGRANKVNEEREDLQVNAEILDYHEAERVKLNKEYDRELAELTANMPNSALLDQYQQPIKTTPSQSQINEIESRRATELTKLAELDQIVSESKQLASRAIESAVVKQQASTVKSVQFSSNGGSSVDFDVTSTVQVKDPHNENFAAKVAANRAKSLANNAARAQAEMTRNTRPPEAPSATQVPTPVTPPNRPTSTTQTPELV